MRSTGKTRSGSFDLVKFLLAIAVILFHGKKLYHGDATPLFRQGASAVEGFFLISGLFMAKAAIERKKESFDYVKSRYVSVFPYHVFAFICAFLTKCYLNGYFKAFSLTKLRKILILIIRSVPELLLFPPMSGLQFKIAGIINMEWYLSALLLGIAILYPIIRKWPKVFCTYIAPLIFLFLSGWLFQKKGSYRTTIGYSGFVATGLIRGITLMSAGCSIYWFAEQWKSSEKKSILDKQWIVTLGIILCWGVAFWFFNSGEPKKYIFAVIYFMIFGTYLMAIQNSWFEKILNNKFIYFLGKLSFPIYLNQGWVRRIFKRMKLRTRYITTMGLYVGLTILVSIVCIIVMDAILREIRKRKAKEQQVQIQLHDLIKHRL